MKFHVICNVKNISKLKFNKIYLAEQNIFSHLLTIYDVNNNYIGSYTDDKFVSLENYRNKRINKIL